jgi:putative transposase
MTSQGNPNSDVRTGRDVIYNLHVHLAVVTKYRRGVRTNTTQRCEQTRRDVLCAHFDAELREFHGEPDQVHLLVDYPPKVQLSKRVKHRRNVSARLLRRNSTPRPLLPVEWPLLVRLRLRRQWGGAPLTFVGLYIEKQQCPYE